MSKDAFICDTSQVVGHVLLKNIGSEVERNALELRYREKYEQDSVGCTITKATTGQGSRSDWTEGVQ